MPCNYTQKLGARSYKDFTDENLKKAVKACRDECSSIKNACDLHGVKRGTLHKALKGRRNDSFQSNRGVRIYQTFDSS